MNLTPQFLEAIDRHQAMAATLGPDHPLTIRAMMLATALAPDEFKTLMRDKARELGLIPKQASGYLPDGTPVYTVADMAATLGQTEEEVKAGISAMLAHRAALGLCDLEAVDPATVHKVQ